MAVDRLHPFEEPQFDARHILSLQRGRVNGNKALQFVGEQFRIGLAHIAAHGLAYDHRATQVFRAQDPIQPLCFVHQGKFQPERPGSAMAGGVPYQQVVVPLKTGNLFVKQPMVCGQPGQENQRDFARAVLPADPVMDVPAGRRKDSFLHGHPLRKRSVLCCPHYTAGRAKRIAVFRHLQRRGSPCACRAVWALLFFFLRSLCFAQSRQRFGFPAPHRRGAPEVFAPAMQPRHGYA